ncbi:hybrid sensor histidine kinase/response regulator [Siccirubricoccus sp. KC 17139]|uniref:histidine kinase n=1 Tax=Siccirubricoccus soli TaxID=2899147 RepID=A0ABT1D7T9_9PROT|nr:hybrid sensor histidine kinase/response regulator [Siccirubricoccus soli]MCO6417949.1 hybrid sensor histidine kinase/response regulator [Siccirubricoccus soli]MCP2684084.1 hybrid sensor histidine kinase/response regulator [Siccirubricoccus soli]
MSGQETDYSQFSLLDLFRLEAETHTQALTAGLLALEQEAAAAPQLEACMRAAHSLKGAARLIGLMPAVELGHAMEDLFVAAQRGRLVLGRGQIDLLLRGVDMLGAIARAAGAPGMPDDAMRAEVAALRAAIRQASAGAGAPPAPLAEDAPPPEPPLLLTRAGPPPGPLSPLAGSALPSASPLPAVGPALPPEPLLPLAGAALPPDPLSPLPAVGPALPPEPLLPLAGAALPPDPPSPLAGAALPPEPLSPLAGSVLSPEPPSPLAGSALPSASPLPAVGPALPPEPPSPLSRPAAPPRPATQEAGEAAERILRVTADSLSRLLGLSGETLVEARRLRPFSDRLTRLRRLQFDALRAFDMARDALPPEAAGGEAQAALAEARRRLMECQDYLSERLVELDAFDRRVVRLAHRLYDETLASRMRPFEDGVRRYARTVRDLGRELGKQVRLEILGGNTPVDRDILEHLDAPLGHLLRNAIDHGIEPPAARLAAGKPAEGTIRLEARHHGGMLRIIIADDGRGIDLERLRATVLARGLAGAETAGQLSPAELLEFLFLPGFTMSAAVTEISGRGVGLDAVQAAARRVRGVVRAASEAGRGARFQFELPLSLSVVRTLVVEIGGEPYALPLASLEGTLKLPRAAIETLEGQQHFSFAGRQIGLVGAQQLLGGGESAVAGEEIPVVIIGDQRNSYGLAVERLLAQRELVVQPLDVRLGKVTGVSAAAVMEDGSPVLILDVDDLLRAVEKLTATGRLGQVTAAGPGGGRRRRRVLVVDDSLTIRELERKLLGQHGYEVEVAVDGMDGWNAVRAGHFDLVVTDIDMPRMDGIELVTFIRKDPHLRGMPVMIVSYKDREEDRRRGLEAGADYYLTKGSFQDQALVQAVIDLIGEAETP